MLVQRSRGVQGRLLDRHQQGGPRQQRQEPRLGASRLADPADDGAADRGGDDDAGPRPCVGEDGERGIAPAHSRHGSYLDAVQVPASAEQQSDRDEDSNNRQQDQGARRGLPAAWPGEGGGQSEQNHDRIEQGRRVQGGVGERQRHSGGHHPPGGVRPISGPDDKPGRQSHQEQRHGVVGGERSQVQRRAQDREQCGSEERGPPSVQPAGGGPQQGGSPQHEDQRQHSRSGQTSDAVRERSEQRIDDRRPGKERRELGQRRAVQHVRPLQMTRP